jgi:hypothetical protein
VSHTRTSSLASSAMAEAEASMCCGVGAHFAVNGNNPQNILNGDLVSLSTTVQVR